MRAWIGLAAASLLLLAACGGGGADDAPAGAVRLQLFGDSTQADAVPLYRARIAAVIDSARRGAWSDDAVTGVDRHGVRVAPAWPESVSGDVVILNYGINDAAGGDVQRYKANLRKLAVAPGAIVIFQTPNPVLEPGRPIAEFAQAMREVAAEVGVPLIDVHACLLARQDWTSLVEPPPIDGPRVHLTAEGYQVVVNACVLPILGALVPDLLA